MTEIMLTPITEKELAGRTVMDTGVQMLGLGGNDYRCGHCGRVMVQQMRLDEMKVEMAWRCGECGGFSVLPKPSSP